MSIGRTTDTRLDPNRWPTLFDYTMDRINALLVVQPHENVTFGAFTYTDLTVTTLTTTTLALSGALSGATTITGSGLATVGSLSVGGTADVTGVLTVTAGVTVSSLTASEAVFTDGSKGLVSNAITGTGNVVMSASPTLTGTITAAIVTLSGLLTANNGIYDGLNSMSVYGMEIGTNSNGIYIKWGNGLMVCYGALSSVLACNNVNGSCYFVTNTFTYPSSFKTGTAPQIYSSNLLAANLTWGGMATAITESSAVIYLVSSFNGGTGKLTYLAIGMYK